MTEECLFCRIRDEQIPARIVHQDEDVLAFEDISPQAPTHTLVIPRKHIATTNDATPEDAALLGRLVLVAARLAQEKGLAEDGYRLVMNCQEGAGQSVFHIHLHLLGGRRLAWPPG